MAGSDGTYELRSVLTPLLASLTTRDGLDVELNLFHGARHYSYLSQVVPDRTIGGWVYRAVTDPLAEAPSVKANSRNALNIALDSDLGQRLGRDLLEAGPGLPGDPRPPAPPGCGPYEKIGVKPAMTTVATAIARNGVTINTQYTREAKSTISTGASTDGVHFATAGTREPTARVRAEFEDATAKRGQAVGRIYQMEWLHTVAERLCAKDMTGKHYRAAHKTSPDEGNGGGQPVDVKPTWTCPAPRPGGRTVVAKFKNVGTDDDRAKTYDRAFGFTPTDRGSLVGSATSGYSESVKITFIFSKPRKGYWCGDTSYPTAKGQIVQGFQK